MIKKILALMAIVLMVVAGVQARDRVTRDTNVLPAAARNLIKEYFPKTEVSHIKIDSNVWGSVDDYEVILNNGTEIEFDKNGKLKDIDCGHNAVPSGLIIKPIRDYIAQNFKNYTIVGLK